MELDDTPNPTPPPPPRRRMIGAACIIYVVLVLALFVSNRYLADVWWPATFMLYAPRWPWLLPALAIIIFAKGKWMRFAAGLMALVVLGPLMDFNIPWRRLSGATPKGTPFRLLSFNEHAGGFDLPTFESFVKKSNPDVMVFQDYADRGESAFIAQGWKTLHLNEAFVASRYPIRHVDNLRLPDITGDDDTDVPRYVGSAWCFDIQTPGGLVHVLDVHLASPHYGLTAFKSHPGYGIRKLKNNAIRRVKECVILSDYLARLKGPVVLAGDFNMLPENRNFRRFFASYADAFQSVGWGWGYTHYTKVSQLRLDHVLYTPDIACTGFKIGPNCQTAHRPVAAELVIHDSSTQ